jgi:DNA-binding CsgD family transcriptional regulator
MTVGLAGRDAELRAIRHALTNRPGRLNAVVVEGAAGIGKTSLLRHVFDEHADGIALAARPVESERQLTFAALGDLLTGVADAVVTNLPAPQQDALDAALLRAASGRSPGIRAVGTALRTVLSRLAAGGPVLVVVDDVQWADEPSVAALAFAVRRLEDCDVRLVVAERVDAGSAPVDPLGLDGALLDRPARVRVAPLTLGAVFHVVRAHTGVVLPRPLLVRVTDESCGNPLYAIELARAIAESAVPVAAGDPLPVSGTLDGLIESRLARTPPEWEPALLALALSRDPPLDELERAVPGATDVVDAAHAARLVEWRDGRLRFSHPLFAAGVVRRSSPAARQAMHRRLAATSEGLERRARHLALGASGPDETIARTLADAARGAARRGAWGQAAELAGLAERATPAEQADEAHDRALLRSGFLARAGDAQGAQQIVSEVLRHVGVGELRARALEQQARLAFDSTGAEASLLPGCDEALDLTDDPALRARIHATRGAIGSYVDVERAIDDAEQALALLASEPAPDPAVYVTAVMVLTGCRFERGEPLCSDLIERALVIEREQPNPDVGDRLGPALGSFLKYSGRLAEAREHLLAGYQAACDEGDDGSLPYAVSHLPQVELWAGRPAEAERWAEEHLAISEHTGQAGQRISALYNLAQIHTEQGRFDDAEAELDAADAIARESDGSWTEGPLASARGYLYLLRGEVEPAIAELRRSIEVFTATGAKRPRRVDRELAEALVRAGRLDDARPVIDRLAAASAAVGHRDLLGGALTCDAMLAAAEQRLDDAANLIEDALTELAHGEEPVTVGRALLVQGQIHRRRGERRLAVDVLARAERILTDAGALPWAARAAEERSRVPIRQPRGHGMTQGEHRIALAAARGLTNQEIAAELFVSVKTVEANLTRVYTKLEVRSRAELAARLAAGSSTSPNS